MLKKNSLPVQRVTHLKPCFTLHRKVVFNLFFLQALPGLNDLQSLSYGGIPKTGCIEKLGLENERWVKLRVSHADYTANFNT